VAGFFEQAENAVSEHLDPGDKTLPHAIQRENAMNCRHCGSPLHLPLIDLGSSPPSNSYLSDRMLRCPEAWFPLRVLVCESCWLVQTEDSADAETLFSEDYAYFSSYSTTWLEHARNYTALARERFQLGAQSLVVEIAANDGYLLQYVREAGIPCYGVEPTASTARAAREKGIKIIEDFFGEGLADQLAQSGQSADLIIANNVLAHVPDINDFTKGLEKLLKPGGVVTLEFPHLLNLLKETQFDTLYHEHYSYLSLGTVRRILDRAGLEVFDVDELPTHGGSLRLFVQQRGKGRHPITGRVAAILEREKAGGLEVKTTYASFQQSAERVKDRFLDFLLTAKQEGKTVGAYGAAAKGNTLLNFAGIKSDLIRFVVDRNPAKQAKYLPGSRIPIVPESHLRQARPDYVVILPWNLSQEIKRQLGYVQEWGGRFVTAVPDLKVDD
jgi:SAM-dependent methyltransferase